MLNVLHDGIVVFYTYYEALIVFFVSALGLGALALKYFINSKSDFWTKAAAALCIGVINLSLASFGLVTLSYFWPPVLQVGSYTIFCLAIFVLFRALITKRIKVIEQSGFLIGGMMLFLLLLVRLAFLRHIVLPPYSDSPVHYQIVLGFLQPETHIHSNLSLDTIFNNYYHFGFHSLVAWMSSIMGESSLDMMPFLGQLFLVIAPLSIMFILKVITGNRAGALFAGLLSAVGWYMPAFAVNWGKYPALASLAVLPAVVACLAFWIHERPRSLGHYVWMGVLVAGAVLLHTRVIVSLLLLAGCYVAAKKFQLDNKFGFFQSVRYALLYLLSLWPLKTYIVDFYAGWGIAVVLCLLLPFAFREFSKISVGVLLFTIGIWLIADLPHLFNSGYQGVFDRQYVEIMLYIPFSLLAGMGVAGLLKNSLVTEKLRLPVVFFLAGIVLWSFLSHPVVFPDPCCDYFKEDDQRATSWLKAHVQENDLVLISAFDNDGQIVGTDAGVWVYPLLGLNTNKVSFDTDWTKQSEVAGLCASPSKAVYIYAGGRSFSFNNEVLAQKIELQEAFRAGQTRIFQVSGCIG